MKIKGHEVQENSMLRIEDTEGVVVIGFIHSVEILKNKLGVEVAEDTVAGLVSVDITTDKDQTHFPEEIYLYKDEDIKDYFLIQVVDDGFTEEELQTNNTEDF